MTGYGTETVRLLWADYRRATGVLAELQGLLTRTGDEPIGLDGPWPARLEIEALHRFLADDLAPQLAFEDMSLCPVLARSGLHRLGQVLFAERTELWPLAHRLQAISAGALLAGFDRESWAAFRHLQDFVDRLATHLRAERSIVLAVVDDLLTQDADRALAAAHRAGAPSPALRPRHGKATRQPSTEGNAA